jgi:hypothetical protein
MIYLLTNIFQSIHPFSRSQKPNSIVILQHSHYIKLVDLTTYQITPISNDVSSAKLFSRYLLIKRLNTDANSISISHVNNVIDNGFRSLPKRFESQGNVRKKHKI